MRRRRRREEEEDEKSPREDSPSPLWAKSGLFTLQTITYDTMYMTTVISIDI